MTEHEVTIEIPAFSISFKVTATPIEEAPPPPPDPEPLPEPGTAFTLVQGNTVIEPHDLYVLNPGIDFARFDGLRKPGSLALAYSAVTIMPRYGIGNAYYDGLRAVAGESDYWHTANPPSPANRVVHPSYPTALWLLRPSVSLAQGIAAYNIGVLHPSFQGTMCDESQGTAPPFYVNAWRTAVEFVEAELPQYQADWVASVKAQFATYKSAWGSAKAVIANSGGAPYAGIDGFTIEAGHITALGANGLDWAKAQGAAQKSFWEASPAKFGVRPILITWNYPDKIPGWYLGTSV